MFWNVRVVLHEMLMNMHQKRFDSTANWLIPYDAAYYSRLAASESEQRIENLRKSLYLYPASTSDRLQLSAEMEADGKVSEAEKLLLEASSYDAGLTPRWALANFYLRNGQDDKFFLWANRYRSFASQPSSGLLRLALETNADVSVVLQHLGKLPCPELAEMLKLIDERGLPSQPVISGIAQCQDPASMSQWAQHIGRLLQGDQPRLARSQWQLRGLHDSLFNQDFGSKITEQGFDWRINNSPGISLTQQGDQAGLQMRFDPTAAEGSVIIFQPVILEPDKTYNLAIRPQSEGVESVYLHAEIVELSTGKVLLSGMNQPDSPDEARNQWTFRAPKSDKTLVLALVYSGSSHERTTDLTIALNDISLKQRSASK